MTMSVPATDDIAMHGTITQVPTRYVSKRLLWSNDRRPGGKVANAKLSHSEFLRDELPFQAAAKRA